MKKLRLIFIILLVVVILLPIVSYMGIVITNDSIADGIEKELTAHKLPASTELVDSISIAGKLILYFSSSVL